ncbi:MAG: glycosyltransferase [Candidatus Riflebacteria bacterium]|nr:glycosyltransferase [Candidatus Riflebacteria bacterium]
MTFRVGLVTTPTSDRRLAGELSLLAPEVTVVPISLVPGSGWGWPAPKRQEGRWRIVCGEFPGEEGSGAPTLAIERAARALEAIVVEERLLGLHVDGQAGALAAARLGLPFVFSLPLEHHPTRMLSMLDDVRGWATLVCRTERHAVMLRRLGLERVQVVAPFHGRDQGDATSIRLPGARPRLACLASGLDAVSAVVEAVRTLPSPHSLLSIGPLEAAAVAMLEPLDPAAGAIRVGVPADPIRTFRACDLLVLASPSPLQVPAFLPEAMRARRPLVAIRHSAAAAFLEPETEALLVEEGDTAGMARVLRTLLDDRPRARKLASASWKKAGRLFSRTTVRAGWRRVYDRLSLAPGIT